MFNLILFGGPGSGKGTQAIRIAEKYNIVHLSTGDVFRKHISENTKIGQHVKEYIDKGLLIPDVTVLWELYRAAFHRKTKRGFIFDGFPRTHTQCGMLDKLLDKKQTPVSMVVLLKVPEKELVQRLINRAGAGNRTDDTMAVIPTRIKVYKQQAQLIRNYYKPQGKLYIVDGMGSVDEVFNSVCKCIDLYIKKHPLTD
jgi:adenylate kinase